MAWRLLRRRACAGRTRSSCCAGGRALERLHLAWPVKLGMCACGLLRARYRKATGSRSGTRKLVCCSGLQLEAGLVVEAGRQVRRGLRLMHRHAVLIANGKLGVRPVRPVPFARGKP
jgi:hypothetical protein